MLGEVDEYNYFVQAVSADPNLEKEIRRRIKVGWRHSASTLK